MSNKKEMLTFEQAIKARGITQKALSEETGISGSAISSLKTGMYCSAIDNIKSIAEVLKAVIVITAEDEDILVQVNETGERIKLEEAQALRDLTNAEIEKKAGIWKGFLKKMGEGTTGALIEKMRRIAAAINCEIWIVPESKAVFYCVQRQ